MNIKQMEAVIEAVLFTMGESVKLDKIAETLGEEKDTVRNVLRKMEERYEKEDQGIRLIELEDSVQLCTKQELYEYLIRIARTAENARIDGRYDGDAFHHRLQAAGDKIGSGEDQRSEIRSCGQQTDRV